MDFDGDFLEKEIAPSSVDVKQMNIIYIFGKLPIYIGRNH
jgi:hypothetical protein